MAWGRRAERFGASARNFSNRVRRFSAGAAGAAATAGAAARSSRGGRHGQGGVDPQFARPQGVRNRFAVGHDHCPADDGLVAAGGRFVGRLHLEDELGCVLSDFARFGGDFVGNAQQFDLGRPGKSFFFSTLITSSVVCPCSTAAA